MVPTFNLEAWIHEQYYRIGVDRKGVFIGKKAFKRELIAKYPARRLEICQLVNK